MKRVGEGEGGKWKKDSRNLKITLQGTRAQNNRVRGKSRKKILKTFRLPHLLFVASIDTFLVYCERLI